MLSIETSTGAALGLAMKRLAIDALSRGIGESLPTNAQYVKDHQLGAGTLQRALAFLEERDALNTTSHGHKGRRIRGIDVGILWQLGGLAPIRVLLPPGGPEEIDHLQTSLARGLTDLGIPHRVHHLRGGVHRLAAVRAGEHDLAVTSAGAAQQARNETSEQVPTALTRVLPQGTYYAPGSLVLVHRTENRHLTPQRVAIDSGSPDHSALTKAQFPAEEPGRSYVEMPFTDVPAAVLRGDVDVGIWHRQQTIIPIDLAGLSASPLTSTEAGRVWRGLSNAVLTGRSGRPEIAAVLTELPLAAN